MPDDRYSRQSFLGENSQQRIERARVCIVGLGGGGSHIVQQLAHIGFQHYVLYDGDHCEESNLNRLIGGTARAARCGVRKTSLARRMIQRLQPAAVVECHDCRWQDEAGDLRHCHLVFGCIDSFSEREQLEAACRRYLIPLIDIGMDVHRSNDEPPRMGGQVILSMPGGPCMKCLGFLNEHNLAREAAAYGAAGPRPQVVWPNGVLASTAVGIAVDMVTGWSGRRHDFLYLSYDGNAGTIMPHVRSQYVDGTCSHYPPSEVGPPAYRQL